MFFLDSSGFFSLVGLLVQCNLAWVLVGLFAVLLRQGSGPEWFRRWLWAFVALGFALTAVSVRFVLAFRHVAPVEWVDDDAPLTRALYLLYQPGKLLFVWLLLCGVSRLRGGPSICCASKPCGLLLAYGAAGALLAPQVEVLLLLQAPVMILGTLVASHWLRSFHKERQDVGSLVVIMALLACAALWTVYAVSVIGWLLTGAGSQSLWLLPVRFNSYFDLIGQVVLATGMIVMVLQDAQHATHVAHRERDQLRDQLARDDKLRALGTLVSGVAHELNNPLTSILGFSDSLSSQDAAVRENAGRIVREQAERCRGIVKSLSALAGQRARSHEPVRLPDLIDRVVRGFVPTFAADRIEVRTGAAADLPAVSGDPVGLEQVLTNLIANAVHATPPGGTITVQASHVDGEVRIAVLDSGPGVPADVAARMFEPFFTTKAPGIGTGLGLALARALARAHQGDLVLVDRPAGTGAEFVVRLPALRVSAVAERTVELVPVPPGAGAVPAALAGGAAVAPAPPSAAGLELLVIDDEPLVREVIAIRARQAGWKVTEAEGGEAGLLRIEQHEQGFDAVVCDLRMPGLSGLQIHDRLAQRLPEVLARFVFVTGDSSSGEALEFMARSACPLIEKPFDFNRLLRELSRVARRCTVAG
jgi:signal transduction histidine kinase/ActR/RegA family two-component response regulator